MSRTLLHHGWRVRPLHGCLFKPHTPTVLHLNLHTSGAPTRRLRQPRILPVERPTGPHLPGIIIDWAKWAAPDTGASEGQAQDIVSAALDTWYTGAEAELLTHYGLIGHDDESSYVGIGLPPEEVVDTATRRFRDVPNSFGILGHRLEWTCRAVHLANALGHIIYSSAHGRDGSAPPRSVARHTATLSRIGHRACSFARDCHARPNDDDGAAFWPLVSRGLKLVAELVRSRHGRRPRLCRWKFGFDGNDFEHYQNMLDELEDALNRLARERTRKLRARLRTWAKSLPEHAGHKITKSPDATLSMSASADKAHRGERTPQAAADSGALEWGPIWLSEHFDQAERIMKAIDDLELDDCDMTHPLIGLPPIDPSKMAYVARRVRASTGVGGDWIRLAHIGRLLSSGALTALARWFEAVERVGRWPSTIRSVIEVALAKKTGGGGPPHRPGSLSVQALGQAALPGHQGRPGAAARTP